MHPVSTSREALDLARTARLPRVWPGRRAAVATVVLGGVGAGSLAAGLLWAPERTWAGVLIAGLFLLGPALGNLVFVALLHVTGAGWATAVRRVPEALVSLLPVSLVAIGAALVLAPDIYPWWHEHLALGGFKGWWLDPLTFRLRALVYAAVWLGFGFWLRSTASGSRRPVGASALFLVVFAFTFWLASVDWLMSFEPHWYSTIFGVYHFASLFTAALAAALLAGLWLRRRGILAGVLHAEHLHDLGKLLFAFTTFWAYTWFSQYMLIWYADLPEEALYFTARAQGPWRPVFWAVFVLHWALPFLLLLTRRAKRSPWVLVTAACAVLAGRFLDLALTVLPALPQASGTLGPWRSVCAQASAGSVSGSSPAPYGDHPSCRGRIPIWRRASGTIHDLMQDDLMQEWPAATSRCNRG